MLAEARAALRRLRAPAVPRVSVVRIRMAEVPQFGRLVEFVEEVDDYSAGDPALQELVARVRHDLVSMKTTEVDDDR
jgi:hypothetical protein